MSLLERMRKARERDVDVAGRRFTIRRPSDAEAIAMDSRRPLDFARAFVVGWDLRELDVVPGGTDAPAPFSPEVWREYVDDHPELWDQIALAILDDYRAHVGVKDDEKKG